MKRLKLNKILLGLALILSLFMVRGWLGPVLAHSPTSGSINIRVSDEKIGPYILLVATYPDPATIGQMDVWVRVGEDGTNRFLRDAVVTIEATSRNGGAAQTAEATHDLAGNAFDYVGHLDLETTGQWDFVVRIDSDLGPANVTFSDNVRWFNTQLLISIAGAVIVLAVVLGLYLWRQSAAAELEPVTSEQVK
jgi:hypothetical protein